MISQEIEYKFLVYGCLKPLMMFPSNSLATIKQSYLDLEHPLTEYMLDKYFSVTKKDITECRIRTTSFAAPAKLTAKSKYIEEDFKVFRLEYTRDITVLDTQMTLGSNMIKSELVKVCYFNPLKNWTISFGVPFENILTLRQSIETNHSKFVFVEVEQVPDRRTLNSKNSKEIAIKEIKKRFDFKIAPVYLLDVSNNPLFGNKHLSENRHLFNSSPSDFMNNSCYYNMEDWINFFGEKII